MNYSPIDSSELSNNLAPINASKPKVQPTGVTHASKPQNKFVTFLNTGSATLLMTSMGFSIGFTFRDFIKEFIESVVNTIIYFVSKKNMGLNDFNMFNLIKSFIVLILIVIINYYVYKIIA